MSKRDSLELMHSCRTILMQVNSIKGILRFKHKQSFFKYRCRRCCSDCATLPESRQRRGRGDKEEGQSEAISHQQK